MPSLRSRPQQQVLQMQHRPHMVLLKLNQRPFRKVKTKLIIDTE